MTRDQSKGADLILFNGRVTTLAAPRPEVSAVAVKEGGRLSPREATTKSSGSAGQILKSSMRTAAA